MSHPRTVRVVRFVLSLSLILGACGQDQTRHLQGGIRNGTASSDKTVGLMSGGGTGSGTTICSAAPDNTSP